MDTPTPPSNNWDDLVTRARQAPAPEDIDVRHRVFTAISQPLNTSRNSWDEILDALTQALPVRIAVGGCALAMAVSLWNGLAQGDELSTILALQNLFYLGL